MSNKNRFFIMLVGTIALGIAWAFVDLSTAAHGQDKKEKKERNPLEGKKGTVIGTLTEKGPNYIELKADGEEKARRYVPQWHGGLPAQGGGPDKMIVKQISELKIGSRLEVEWLFEE